MGFARCMMYYILGVYENLGMIQVCYYFVDVVCIWNELFDCSFHGMHALAKCWLFSIFGYVFGTWPE